MAKDLKKWCKIRYKADVCQDMWTSSNECTFRGVDILRNGRGAAAAAARRRQRVVAATPRLRIIRRDRRAPQGYYDTLAKNMLGVTCDFTCKNAGGSDGATTCGVAATALAATAAAAALL